MHISVSCHISKHSTMMKNMNSNLHTVGGGTGDNVGLVVLMVASLVEMRALLNWMVSVMAEAWAKLTLMDSETAAC